MRDFENSPEIVAVKEILREFFMSIIESIRGAFVGFLEWVQSIKLNLPPMLKLFGNTGINSSVFIIAVLYIAFIEYSIRIPRGDTIVTLKVRMDH